MVALCLLLGVAGLGPASCNRSGRHSEQADDAAPPLTATATTGDATLTVTAERSKTRVAEPLRVTIEVAAPVEADVELPDLPAALQDFNVVDHGPVETELVNDRRTRRQWFALDSTVAGSRSIPSLAVNSTDGKVTTEPLSVEVVSTIAGEFDPMEFADIRGPVAVPKPWVRTVAYIAGGAVLLLGTAALIWVLLRRRAAQAAAAAPPPPPHVWALRQLEALLAEKLVQAGRVQEFYFRLSALVRTYIELRFGLMAPERTTEEFLREVQRSSALRFGHKDLLGEFLTACDLVKFARHEPAGGEIDASIDAARRFIEETVPHRIDVQQEAAA